MPRGGKRQGQVGKAYKQRHDLNPVQAPKAPQGQTYGAAGAQVAAQQAIPLPNGAAPAPGPQGPPPAPPAPGGPPPGSLGPLDAPTQRPGEPLTNGIASGPGAGPEALGFDDGTNQVMTQLRGLFQQYPLSELADLIAEAE